jgi:PKD repeat protein
MNFKILFPILLFLLFCSCEASANPYYEDNIKTLTVDNTQSSWNLSNCDDYLTARGYPDLIRNEGKTWYVNVTLYGDAANFTFDPAEVDTIVFDKSLPSLYGIQHGHLIADNITFTSYDYALGRAPIVGENMPVVRCENSSINNTVFHNMGALQIWGIWTNSIDNITMYDIASDAFQMYDQENISVTNLSINRTGRAGMTLEGTNNLTFRHIRIEHAKSYLTPSTGSEGIDLDNTDKCYDTYFQDIYINDTGYSGFSGTAYNTTLNDAIVDWSGHNSVDLHGGAGWYLDNVTVGYGQDSQNLYITGKDIIIKNMRMIKPRGDQANIGNANWCDNITLENISMESNNSARGICFWDCSNVTCINVTTNDTNYPFYPQKTNEVGSYAPINFAAIDCNVAHYVFLEDAVGAKFINTYMEPYSSTSLVRYLAGDYSRYYYPNIRVVNSTGYTVDGAVITFNRTSINGRGKAQSNFFTDLRGTCYDTGNRTNWPAVISNSFDGNNTAYTTQITASKSGISTSANINPDSSWYSSNPALLAGTEITLTLNVLGQTTIPVCYFTANTTMEEAPHTIQFTDQSLNNPDYWLWDFGDGNTSSLQNPTHTYYTAGNYTVSLEVANSNGNATYSKNNYIKIRTDPVANFTMDLGSGFSPLTVPFTDTSTNIPDSWSWNFGDGNTSSLPNPTHTFAKGNYTVSLNASNIAGWNNTSKNVTVGPPINYMASVSSGISPLTVHFSDTSLVPSIAWAWDLNNDGKIDSNVSNPTYTYMTPGNYTVNMTVTNEYGTFSYVKTNFIRVNTTTVTSITEMFWRLYGIVNGWLK